MTIYDLPWEILAQIFDWVSTISAKAPDNPSPNAATPIYAMPPAKVRTRGRSFPCSTAMVSRYWLSIHKAHPHFWDHIEFDLSQDPSLFADAFNPTDKMYFTAVVYDSRYSNEGPPPDVAATGAVSLEQGRADKVMRTLRPYLRRCIWLEFDLCYSSSLPALPLVMTGVSNGIQGLHLASRVHSPASEMGIPEMRLYDRFNLPRSYYALHQLSLTVPIFMAMGRTYPIYWSNLLGDYNGFTITLSHYTFRHYDPVMGSHRPCNVVEFLDYFTGRRKPQTKHLVFRDLSYDEAGGTTGRADRIDWQSKRIAFTTLTFDKVSTNFLQAVFSTVRVGGERVNFRACVLPANMTESSIGTEAIGFEEIESTQNVVNCLRAFAGMRMHFIRSRSFNDDLLHAITRKFIDTLEIVGCHNFTYAALKPIANGLRGFRLCGQDLPELGPEELEWLSQDEKGIISIRHSNLNLSNRRVFLWP